jgi:hypothetical protein
MASHSLVRRSITYLGVYIYIYMCVCARAFLRMCVCEYMLGRYSEQQGGRFGRDICLFIGLLGGTRFTEDAELVWEDVSARAALDAEAVVAASTQWTAVRQIERGGGGKHVCTLALTHKYISSQAHTRKSGAKTLYCKHTQVSVSASVCVRACCFCVSA